MGNNIRVRFFTVAAAMLLLLQTASSAQAQRLRIEQVYGQLPEIEVYFYLENEVGAAIPDALPSAQELAVSYDGVPLTVTDCLPAAQKGMALYILLDVSTSMPQAVFQQVTQRLADCYRTRAPKDKLVLITFGEEVRTVLDGTQDMEQVQQILKNLRPTENKTRFLDALALVSTLRQAGGGEMTRQAAVVITDGVDFNKGGSTFEETRRLLAAGNMPVFALGLETAAKEDLDTLGTLARSSGGYLATLSSQNTAGRFDDLFSYLDRCCLLRVQTQSNLISPQPVQLTVQLQGEEGVLSASRAVLFDRWKADNEPPRLLEAEQRQDRLLLRFSEAVAGGGEPGAYLLCDSQGRSIPLRQVNRGEGEAVAELVLESPLYDGEYSLELRGITDLSVERNAAPPESFAFTVTGFPYTAQSFFREYKILMLTLILFAAALIAAVLLASRRKQKEQLPTERERAIVHQAASPSKVVIEPQKGIEVHLQVVDPGQAVCTVILSVCEELVIGRSQQCGVCIRDSQISRRNSRLFVCDDALWVEDLGSTNGTILNGIPVAAPRRLCNGDVLHLGDSKVTVSF